MVGSPDGGLTVSGVGLARLLYYQDADGTIRELNNTLQYPNEVWMQNVTSSSSGGNSGTMVSPNGTAIGPTGSVVAKGIPNGRVAMASGFRGLNQELWLFYQSNATDVVVQVRDAQSPGQWSSPTQVTVGI